MVNEFKLLPALFKFTLFVVMLFLVVFKTTCAAAVKTPWDLGKGEYVIEGKFEGIQKNNISINTSNGKRLFPLEAQAFIALMGNRYGRLVLPEDFPPGLDVELFITPQGTVRAMRNKVSALVLPEGQILPGWGHSASLSPDEKHYLIYNLGTGLSLYSVSPDCRPLLLSFSSIAAWNKRGNKIVYVSAENLLIYDIDKKTKTSLPLEKPREKSALIVTDLAWNYSEDKLLYASLQDYPDLGSDLFQITVLDINGKPLAVKNVPNLGPAVWLKNDLILFVTYENIEQDKGEVQLWDYRTGKTASFLPPQKGGYHNLCLNSEKEKLAYTLNKGTGADLYLMDICEDTPEKILFLPLPVRNLQWSGCDTLFYWDYMNNHIYEVNDFQRSCAPQARANGYLPVGAVKNRLLYFLSEPWEEPQQPLLLEWQ